MIKMPSNVSRIGVSLAVGLALISAPLHAERLPLRNYRSADGLPHDRVKRIVRDSVGFLWFGTVEGLARFDGWRFARYSVDDGLPHPSVNDILETAPGVYWIATQGGLARFAAASRR